MSCSAADVVRLRFLEIIAFVASLVAICCALVAASLPSAVPDPSVSTALGSRFDVVAALRADPRRDDAFDAAVGSLAADKGVSDDLRDALEAVRRTRADERRAGTRSGAADAALARVARAIGRIECEAAPRGDELHRRTALILVVALGLVALAAAIGAQLGRRRERERIGEAVGCPPNDVHSGGLARAVARRLVACGRNGPLRQARVETVTTEPPIPRDDQTPFGRLLEVVAIDDASEPDSSDRASSRPLVF